MITLQFCGFDSLVARTIERFTDTEGGIGHVDIVLENGALLGAQNQSGLGGMPSGVQIRPWDYGKTCGMENMKRATLKGLAEGEALAWLLAQVGKPYNLCGIGGFVLGDNWNDPDAWFCSQLATVYAQKAGAIETELYAPANKVTPAMLAFAVSAITPLVPWHW